MKLRPLGKNVLIQPIEARKVSAGGIVLPQGEKTGAREGLVLAVAEGGDLKPENRILFERHAPSVDAGEGKLLVHIDHVLAVLG